MDSSQGFFQRHPDLVDQAWNDRHKHSRSCREIARDLSQLTGENVSDDTVWRMLNREGKRRMTEALAVMTNEADPAPPSESSVEPDTTLSRLDEFIANHQAEIERRVRQQQDKLRAMQQKRVIDRNIRDIAIARNHLEDQVEALVEYKPNLTPPKLPEIIPGEPASMAVLISDTQVGIVVDPEETGPRWEYSTNKFKTRLKYLEEQIYKIKSRTEASGRVVTTLHLWMLGDLVENHSMRIKSRITTDMGIRRQVSTCFSQFNDMVVRLSQVFPKIYIDVVPGNHGRVGKYGDDRVNDNYDLMVGDFLRVGLRFLKNVTVTVSEGPHLFVELRRNRIMLTHGDTIRSGSAETPQATITRRVAHWQTQFGTKFDFIVMGHFHTPTSWFGPGGVEIFVNGAFFSASDYSLNNLGLTNPAAQWVLVFDDTGLQERYNILLESPEERELQCFTHSEG